MGAHVRGLNGKSIGVCLIGNGNKADFEVVQMDALDCKLRELRAAYPDAKIIAHREVNQYLPKKYHTRKSCPGKTIDMDWLRGYIG